MINHLKEEIQKQVKQNELVKINLYVLNNTVLRHAISGTPQIKKTKNELLAELLDTQERLREVENSYNSQQRLMRIYQDRLKAVRDNDIIK